MRGLRLPGAAKAKPDTSANDLLFWQLETADMVKALGHAQREMRFAEPYGREWRFDIAYPGHALAIEVDGGIWSKGAHGHPVTITRNMEKRNFAAALGWRILCFTPQDVRNGIALYWIEKTIKGDVNALFRLRSRPATAARKTAQAPKLAVVGPPAPDRAVRDLDRAPALARRKPRRARSA